MPNKKKQTPAPRKANQAKRKPRQPPKAGVNTLTKAVTNRFTHQVCGLTDPFCNDAIGSKFPDDSSTRTLPYTRRGRVTMNSDASGDLAYVFNPQYVYEPFTYASVRTGSAVTSWADSGAASVMPNVTKYRIVSCGFRLKSVLAPPVDQLP